jgi:hypothetical protein
MYHNNHTGNVPRRHVLFTLYSTLSMRTIYHISRYNLSVLLVLLCAAAQAQNLPVLTETAPSGTATVAIPPPTITPDFRYNYRRNFVPKVPLTDPQDVTINANPAQVAVSTEYTDGFSRALETVVHDFTPGKSLVSVADNRPSQDLYSYLPYVAGGNSFRKLAFQEQSNYYNFLYPGEAGVAYSYTRNTSTSAKRSVTSYAPGKSQAGQGRGTEVIQGTNAAGTVAIWELDGSGNPVITGYYGAGQLFMETIIVPSENVSAATVSPKSITYKDKEGRVVLSQVADSAYFQINPTATVYTYGSTYYVYDVMGHLRYMLPPKAVALIGAATSVSGTIRDNLCFQYTYDSKGRATGTRKPGEDAFTNVVYDRKDRVVMRQNALEAERHEWEISYYDLQGRVKATSVYTDNNSYPYTTWQQNVDNYTGSNTSDMLYYLSTNAGELMYPDVVTDNVIMSYTWYDNYDIADPGGSLWDTYYTNPDNGSSPFFPATEQSNTPGAETPLRSLPHNDNQAFHVFGRE